jgi:hypothetical protein
MKELTPFFGTVGLMVDGSAEFQPLNPIVEPIAIFDCHDGGFEVLSGDAGDWAITDSKSEIILISVSLMSGVGPCWKNGSFIKIVAQVQKSTIDQLDAGRRAAFYRSKVVRL